MAVDSGMGPVQQPFSSGHAVLQLAAHEGTLYVTEEGNRAIRTVNLATRHVGTLSLPYSSAMLRAFAPGNAVCVHRNRFLLVGGNWGIGSIDLRAKPLAGACH